MRELSVLITGATDGIGLETARQIATRGADVILHGRDDERLAKAARDVRSAAPDARVETVRADFASLADVRAMVDDMERRQLAPDALVNNAGVFVTARKLSADGHERTFAVNHLAPFLLTHAMLHGPSGTKLRRIVNVSSMAHAGGGFDLDDLDWKRRPYDGYGAYAASKLANILFTIEIARRLEGTGVVANSLHPGVVGTKLLREGFGRGMGSESAEEGAAMSVALATDAAFANVTGRYFAHGREARPSATARDPELARGLYARSIEWTGAKPLGE